MQCRLKVPVDLLKTALPVAAIQGETRQTEGLVHAQGVAAVERTAQRPSAEAAHEVGRRRGGIR